MKVTTEFGVEHFIAQTDAIGLGLFSILLLMSILSWTLIIGRLRLARRLRAADRDFLESFRTIRSISELARLAKSNPSNGFARLVHAGLEADELTKSLGLKHDAETKLSDDLIDRAVQTRLEEDSTGLESGQTLLASVATSAPFIGLFGTVWGIYHALVSIAAAGSSSLDKVAGPVGEALIMTALGLAVAIPAAIAYNLFQRSIRLRVAALERFSHDLFVLMRALRMGRE